MPKKTRRQKMASDKRRNTYIPTFNVSTIPSEKPEQKATSSGPQTSRTKVIIQEDPSYFKNDLSKSILISALIFLLEVGIYLNNHYGFISITQLFHF